MRSNTAGRLVKMIVAVAAMCAFVFPVMAFSQETISSREGLEQALEHAVMCKTDALGVFSGGNFDGDAVDPQTRFETLGVEISKDKHDGTVYRFPRGIKVFGYEASEAGFFSESTTLFFVNFRSASNNLSEINKLLNLKPVPKGNPDGYGYFNEFTARYIRKLPGFGDAPPDTVFSAIRKKDGSGYIVIGCQNLAW